MTPARRPFSWSTLWITLGTILGVDVGFHNAACRTRMVGRGPPHIVEQFDSAELFQHHASPVLRCIGRLETALTSPAVLIAQHSQLPGVVSSQPMRAEQPTPTLVDTRDRAPSGNGRPHQPVNVFPPSGSLPLQRPFILTVAASAHRRQN